MPASAPIAIVLPPREGFSPRAVGAVGMVAHGHAAIAGTQAIVFGAPAATPFAGVAFCPIRPAWWPFRRQAMRYAAALARRLRQRQPALIEVHNKPEIALALAARLPDAKISLFLHNDPQGMRAARSASDRAHLLHRLARVVVVSEWVRMRLLEGVTAPARPPVLLPNGIDLAALPALVPPDRREKLILFAGRMVADKGADLFIEAMGRLLPQAPGWRAAMIGGDRFHPDAADTPFLRRWRPRAAAAGIALHGYQPHAAVLEAMRRAAIVVVPSRWPEPFGLTALEALASGAALICSPRGGLAEVVGEAAWLVDPEDAAALDAASSGLIGDPARRAALGAAGRARARLFDAPEIAARLRRLREEILAS